MGATTFTYNSITKKTFTHALVLKDHRKPQKYPQRFKHHPPNHPHTDTQTHRHTDTQTHRHTHTDTHTHTHTHTHTQIRVKKIMKLNIKIRGHIHCDGIISKQNSEKL